MRDESSFERYSDEEWWKMSTDSSRMRLIDDGGTVLSYQLVDFDDLWKIYRPWREEEEKFATRIDEWASVKQSPGISGADGKHANEIKQSERMMITFGRGEGRVCRDSVNWLMLSVWRQCQTRAMISQRVFASLLRTNLKCTFNPRRISPRDLLLFERFWLEPIRGNHWSRS